MKTNIGLEQRLKEIASKVNEVLGKQKDNVLVIKSITDFRDYIDKCIETNYIAVDTETNNSTDTMTCKLMGLCLYAPGLQQAYIPVNHRDHITKERYAWQVTEHDIEIELSKVISKKCIVIMHNGKFDYEVLKCTCNVDIVPNWDTMIAAKLLNENESAGLKYQYTQKIDKTQDSYKIDKLFENVQYADVDADLFALYAATDSLMTYKLYEYQVNEFKKDQRLFKLFKEIEMPMVKIAAEMEMLGAYADLDYCARLKEKYEELLKKVDQQIRNELIKLQPVFDKWKSSPDAQEHEIIFERGADIKRIRKSIINKANESELSNLGELIKEKSEKEFCYVQSSTGKRYKKGKRKIELIDDEVKLSSPKQLGVLFYSVLQASAVNSFKPFSTGKAELEKLSEQFRNLPTDIEESKIEIFDLESERNRIEKYRAYLKKKKKKDLSIEDANVLRLDYYNSMIESKSNFLWGIDENDFKQAYRWFGYCEKICDLLLQRREIEKLITTYLEAMPKLAKHWSDGKIRFHLNTLGARTGRFSSGGDWRFIDNDEQVRIGGLNAQGIPAKNHEVRLVFKASPGKVFVGGDFGQQEPRLTAFISNDPEMRKTFENEQDIYARIAQAIYKNNYEDNLEFYDKEKTKINLEGKKRRSKGKVIILASMYGMQAGSVARKLKISIEEAECMLDKFYDEFREVKTAIETSQRKCKRVGYTEDFTGRKRRLPNIQLAHYKARFIYQPNMKQAEASKLLEYYLNKAAQGENGFMEDEEFKVLQREARRNNIIIETNKLAIEKAERQCFNARIQGLASTLTKVTMIWIYNDPIIRECDAHLVFQIHDELIMECPEEYAVKVKERLDYIMKNSVNRLRITVPMKCDSVIEHRWGEEAMTEELRVRHEELVKEVKSQQPLKDLCDEFKNFPEDSIKKVIESDNEILVFN